MATITAVADVPSASVQITINNEVVNDTFTRVVANGWGSADTGQAWTTAGGVAGDFSVNGTVGLISVTATASDRFVTLDTGFADQDVTVELDTNTTPTGGSTQYGATARFTDTSNHYIGYASIAITTGAITAVLARRTTSGGLVQLGSVATGLTIATNASLRLEVCGTLIRLKIWTTSTTEPTGWNISVVDPAGLLTGTRAGTFAQRDTGNLTPTVFAYDNFGVDVPFESLYRVYPDGTRSLVRGSPFFFSGNTAVLYDTEAPLNTAVYYQAEACLSSLLSSGSVVIESGEDGWLKDPLRPYRDIKLDNCSVHSPQCISTDANIFFQRLEPETYASTSGVFGIVDAPRPITVAMTRADQQSTLGIVSRKLSDITRIRELLSPGSPLLLQLPTRYGWGIETWGTDYMQVYDDRASRLGDDMGKPYRDWSLPFTASLAPGDVNSGGTGGGTIAPAGFTYGDSTATGRTYAQSTALGRTYLVRTQHPTF